MRLISIFCAAAFAIGCRALEPAPPKAAKPVGRADVAHVAAGHRAFAFRLYSVLPDRPGNLAPLIDHVAKAGANVIDIFHRRAVWLVPVDRVGVEMVLEVRDETHCQAGVRHLSGAGYPVEREGQRLWPC